MENGTEIPGQLSFKEKLADRIRKWLTRIPADEQLEFIHDWNIVADEYETAIRVLERHILEKERQSGRDKLTKLPLRELFENHVRGILEKTPEETPDITALGLVFIDLNNFKPLNDKLGHKIGDQAIQATAEIISETIRTSRDTDFFERVSKKEEVVDAGRWGGDEFLAAVELKRLDEIKIVAERLKDAIDDPKRQRQHGYTGSLPYSAAVGGLAFTLHQPQQQLLAVNVLAEKLFHLADQLMYKSKEEGRVHTGKAQVLPNMDVDPPEVEVCLSDEALS
ncbi:MAG TPA: GGDEF domain-containing protein [Patescibacteria group bacterium]|nr:GGDEF domain-containing protein [Patescibacteria group bacterium]